MPSLTLTDIVQELLEDFVSTVGTRGPLEQPELVPIGQLGAKHDITCSWK